MNFRAPIMLKSLVFIGLTRFQWLGIGIRVVAEQANTPRHVYNETRQVRVVAWSCDVTPSSGLLPYLNTVAEYRYRILQLVLSHGNPCWNCVLSIYGLSGINFVFRTRTLTFNFWNGNKPWSCHSIKNWNYLVRNQYTR